MQTILGWWPAFMEEWIFESFPLVGANFISPNLSQLILDYPLTNFPWAWWAESPPNNCSSAPLRVEQKGKTARHKHYPSPPFNPCAWPAIPHHQLASICSQPVSKPVNLFLQFTSPNPKANRNPPNPTQFSSSSSRIFSPPVRAFRT